MAARRWAARCCCHPATAGSASHCLGLPRQLPAQSAAGRRARLRAPVNRSRRNGSNGNGSDRPHTALHRLRSQHPAPSPCHPQYDAAATRARRAGHTALLNCDSTPHRTPARNTPHAPRSTMRPRPSRAARCSCNRAAQSCATRSAACTKRPRRRAGARRRTRMSAPARRILVACRCGRHQLLLVRIVAKQLPRSSTLL